MDTLVTVMLLEFLLHNQKAISSSMLVTGLVAAMSNIKSLKVNKLESIAMSFYYVNFGLSIITSKNLSNENKKTHFGILIYRTRVIITCGLYTFYPLFEVHLCTVTFGLMFG